MSRPILRVIVLTLGGLLAPSLIRAADPPPVHMIVTVEAHNGAAVPTLKDADVIASQGRDRLSVTELTACQGENAAMELFVVLDDAIPPSAGKFEDVRQFINNQPATVLVGVGHMHNGMVETSTRFTLDHAEAAQNLRLPFGTGAVSVYQAVSDMIQHWKGNADRREVVLIARGGDPTTEPLHLRSAIADAQRAGIIIYTIAISDAGGLPGLSSGTGRLGEFSAATGGKAYTPVSNRADSLKPELDEIAQLLQHQYRVTLVPKADAKAGLEEVKLTIKTPNASLAHAKRMYVTDGR